MKALSAFFLLPRHDCDHESATARPAKACSSPEASLRVHCRLLSFYRRPQHLFDSQGSWGLAPACANSIQAAPRPLQTPSSRNHNRTRQWRVLGLGATCIGRVDDALCRPALLQQACRCVGILVCHTSYDPLWNCNAVTFLISFFRCLRTEHGTSL